MSKPLNYTKFCTEASWLRFLKKVTSCCIGNYHSSCKQVIKVPISVVISLFMCVITSYNALTLYGLTKLGRMLHFIYVFIDIFEDGVYINMCIYMYKSSMSMRFLLLKAKKK